MGSTSGSCDDPIHTVTISKDYYIGETEVTQALWYTVMGQKPTSDDWPWDTTYGLGDNYPAYNISWNDCQAFITKLNQLTGLIFRMPTEAEWEFAAKGGNKSQGYAYSGSNIIDEVAWYQMNSLDKGVSSSDYGTHSVATKKANELGLYDMSGNVREWCSDWYDSYRSTEVTNPTGPAWGSDHVARGGCWGYEGKYCSPTNRDYDSPTVRLFDLGVRLVLTPSE